MGDIIFDTQSSVGLATPAANKALVFVDSVGKILSVKDDSGRVAASYRNSSVASQGAGFSSDTWVTGSDIIIPTFGFLQTRTQLKWAISASKTGAGTATPVYTLRIGSARSTADTGRMTITGPAQTAIADIGTLNIIVTITTVGALGTWRGTAWWDHRGTAASTTVGGVGFANDGSGHVEQTAATAFDMTALSGQYVSLSINGGASAAWTLTQVMANADW